MPLTLAWPTAVLAACNSKPGHSKHCAMMLSVPSLSSLVATPIQQHLEAPSPVAQRPVQHCLQWQWMGQRLGNSLSPGQRWHLKVSSNRVPRRTGSSAQGCYMLKMPLSTGARCLDTISQAHEQPSQGQDNTRALPGPPPDGPMFLLLLQHISREQSMS